MKAPPHPGRIIQDCIDDLELTTTDAARKLDIEPSALAAVISGNAAISPQLALRLSLTFGSSFEMWLRMQASYDTATHI